MTSDARPLRMARALVVWVLLPSLAIPLLGGWLVPGPSGAGGLVASPVLLVVLAPHWLPLLLVSAGATWLAHGAADGVAGLRFALGLEETRLRAARRSLATAARTVVWTGTALGLLPFLRMARLLAASEPSPAHLAEGISGVLLLPMGVVLFGRIALAGAADRAAALDGEPARRVFPGWQDLALVVLLLSTAMALMTTVVRFPVLEVAR